MYVNFDKYNNFWKEKSFLHINDFFSNDIIDNINHLIYNVENNEINNLPNSSLNNSGVNNNYREQLLLYCENYLTNTREQHNIIANYFNNNCNLMLPIINYLNNIIYDIFGKWRVSRATIMYTKKGCPEQEIHFDSSLDTNLFYISIPLHYTPIEQGPTIFYNYSIINKYIENFNDKPKIGYFEDLNNKIKKDFAKARTQYILNLGDILIYKNITLHSGGKNSSDNIRKYLFLICTLGNYGYEEQLTYKNNSIYSQSAWGEPNNLTDNRN
tara:strand:- start:223 stop:1032 length:810 start_codon:yes stop_codon:yes gene_type:complete